MKIARGIALASAALLFAAPWAIRAQTSWQLEVTPMAGGTLFLDDGPNRFALSRGTEGALIVEEGRFANAFTLGVSAGVRYHRFAVEGFYTWLPTKLSASNLPESAEVDAYMYGVTGLFYVPVWTSYGPYWGVGFGGETFDYRSNSFDSHSHWQINFVGGMAFDLNERLGLRIEGRDCLAPFHSGIAGVDDEWENDLMITAGITWRTALGK